MKNSPTKVTGVILRMSERNPKKVPEFIFSSEGTVTANPAF